MIYQWIVKPLDFCIAYQNAIIRGTVSDLKLEESISNLYCQAEKELSKQAIESIDSDKWYLIKVNKIPYTSEQLEYLKSDLMYMFDRKKHKVDIAYNILKGKVFNVELTVKEWSDNDDSI